MKGAKITITVILLCVLKAGAQPQQSSQPMPPRHHLMPVPAAVQSQSGRLNIDASFAVAMVGHADARLEAGTQRAARRLEARTGLTFARTQATDAQAATLRIECRGPGLPVPSVNEDESYTLDVSDKHALLKAATAVGALRGLETFLQLLEGDHSGYYIPAVSIQDRPRFPWRGLLIDSGRHLEPVAA